MKLKGDVFIVILVLTLTVSCCRASTISSRRQNYAPGSKLTRSLATKLIKYLNLDKLNAVPSALQNSSKCDTREEIVNYFFKVYSDTGNDTLDQTDLNNLIQHQVLKLPKDHDLKQRIKENRCPRRNCLHSDEMLRMAKLSQVDETNFAQVCPMMLYNLELEYCKYDTGSDAKVSGAQAWGIGLLLTVTVTLWSWMGCIVLPIIHKAYYKKVLTFMISLAYGCLCSNSLLKFIPLADGFDFPFLDQPQYSYFYKHLLIMAVLFFFFLFERSMKIIAIYKTLKLKDKQRREEKRMHRQQTLESANSFDSLDDVLETDRKRGMATSDSRVKFTLDHQDSRDDVADMELGNQGENQSEAEKRRSDFRSKFRKKMSLDIGEINIIGQRRIHEVTDKFKRDIDKKKRRSSLNNEPNEHEKICCTSLTKGLSDVKPIGWMAIFGDGLSNFIDGLTIGASINQSLVLGFTNALAGWIGNIPQELGDFALLVRAGMTPFQALFYNYASSNSALIGCMVGIGVGNDIEAARWIFSISGATTLYLSLAVLLPNMNEEFDEEKESFNAKLIVTVIQICGILSGYTIMIILNIFEDDIDF